MNPATGKTIEARQGNWLTVTYKGYLGQTDMYKQTISHVTDSSVFLGLYLPELSYESQQTLAGLGLGYREVLLRDILTFRRMSAGRTVLKSFLSFGALVGSIVVLNNLYENSGYSTAAKYGISLGVGLGAKYLVNVLVSDRPKYAVKDGWEIRYLR